MTDITTPDREQTLGDDLRMQERALPLHARSPDMVVVIRPADFDEDPALDAVHIEKRRHSHPTSPVPRRGKGAPWQVR